MVIYIFVVPEAKIKPVYCLAQYEGGVALDKLIIMRCVVESSCTG